MPKASNDASSGKSKNLKGRIAGTNFPTKPAHNQRNGPFWLEERRKRVAQRYLTGASQWEIAREEGVDQATIQNDIKVIQAQWKAQAIQSFDEKQQLELAKIDNLERMAVEAYTRSMGIRKITTKTNGTNGEFVKEEKKVVRERLLGNPQWMDKIQWCIEMRCKILGITKEEKNTQINTLMTINWEQIVASRDGDDINKQIRELEALAGVQPVDNPPDVIEESK